MSACLCDMHERGSKTCHCRGCCTTFSGPSAFDAHWQGGHRTPAEAKLTEVRPGVWGWPDSGRNRPGRSGSGNLTAETGVAGVIPRAGHPEPAETGDAP